MFKKLVIIAALALSSLAQARETINIVWGFAIGSNQANTVRIMCEELNTAQDKYTFVLVHKPGAGGTIAANSVVSDPANTLVSMSSSFIIRPLFEKTEPTHNLDNYIPVLVQGTGSPLYVVSGKYTNMNQVLTVAALLTWWHLRLPVLTKQLILSFLRAWWKLAQPRLVAMLMWQLVCTWM